MKKFKIIQDLDYVQGHLRYGHKEIIVEAESEEDLRKRLEDKDYLETIKDKMKTIVDDYSIDDVGDECGELEIEEIKEEI